MSTNKKLTLKERLMTLYLTLNARRKNTAKVLKKELKIPKFLALFLYSILILTVSWIFLLCFLHFDLLLSIEKFESNEILGNKVINETIYKLIMFFLVFTSILGLTYLALCIPGMTHLLTRIDQSIRSLFGQHPKQNTSNTSEIIKSIAVLATAIAFGTALAVVATSENVAMPPDDEPDTEKLTLAISTLSQNIGNIKGNGLSIYNNPGNTHVSDLEKILNAQLEMNRSLKTLNESVIRRTEVIVDRTIEISENQTRLLNEISIHLPNTVSALQAINESLVTLDPNMQEMICLNEEVKQLSEKQITLSTIQIQSSLLEIERLALEEKRHANYLKLNFFDKIKADLGHFPDPGADIFYNNAINHLDSVEKKIKQ